MSLTQTWTNWTRIQSTGSVCQVYWQATYNNATHHKDRIINYIFVYIYIYMCVYIYLSKSWSVAFIVARLNATFLLNNINGHIIHLFSTLSLLFLILFFLINFSTYFYIFSNFSFFFFLKLFISHYYLPQYHFFSIPLSSFIFCFSYSLLLTINLQFSFPFYS